MQDYIPDFASILFGAISWLIYHCFDMTTEGVTTLVVLMCIDWITGIVSAVINEKDKVQSELASKGILRKFVMLCIVSAGHFLDHFLAVDFIQQALVYAYIGSEAISIFENAKDCGLPIPQKVIDLLEQLRGEKNVGK